LLGSWTFDGLTVAALAALGALYLLGAIRLRGRWSPARTCSFIGGLLALALALVSGIDTYADRLLSVHMAQHLLLMLVAPALGLLGFALAVLVFHLSGLFELALRDETVHALEHCVYLAAGLMLLAPLIAADPLPRRVSAIARVGWLLAAMTVMAIPGALLA